MTKYKLTVLVLLLLNSPSFIYAKKNDSSLKKINQENRNDFDTLKFHKKSVFTINPLKKGDYFISLSVPEGNIFHVKKRDGYYDTRGFCGLTSEFGYYYNDRNFLSGGIGVAMKFDFVYPTPPAEAIGEYEVCFVRYLNIAHGFQANRFAFSYGIQITNNYYHHDFISERFGDTIPYNGQDTLGYNIIENRLGLICSMKFKISNSFSLGLNYLPSFSNITNFNETHYTHLIFFNLIFDFNIRKKLIR